MKLYLLKKQLRDILFSWRLYLSIFLICLFGMIIYSGFNSVQEDLLFSIDNFYQKQNLANYTIKTDNELPLTILNELIDNFVFENIVPFYYSNPSSVFQHYQFKNKTTINIPYLIEGTDDCLSNQVIIDYDYAKKQNISLNDFITLNRTKYEVVGVAKFLQSLYKGNECQHLVAFIFRQAI